jgi:hypothetical protein
MSQATRRGRRASSPGDADGIWANGRQLNLAGHNRALAQAMGGSVKWPVV